MGKHVGCVGLVGLVGFMKLTGITGSIRVVRKHLSNGQSRAKNIEIEMENGLT